MTATSSEPPGGTARPALRGAVGFLVVMELGSGILQGWYPMLLPAMGAEFGVTPAELNWVGASYLLATVVCVPIVAKLGDRYGHRRMLVVAAASVALGSVVVAVAPNFTVLLIGRALQGPLGAFLPLEFAIVRDRDPASAGRSIGKLVGSLTLGAALGVFFAGVLFDAVPDLRIVLWIPAIFMIACVPLVAYLVPESRTRAAGPIDWVGATLLGTGSLATLAGISNAAAWGWTAPSTWATIGTGLVLIVLWIVSAKRVRYPLIDLDVLTRGGIGVPLVIAVLFGAQLFGSQTAGTVFLLTDPAVAGFGLGLSTSFAGLLALASASASFVGASLGDQVAGFLGTRATLALGGALITLNYLALLVAAHILPIMIAGSIMMSLGNGLLISVLPAIVVRKAPADSVGIASALYNTARTGAGAASSALFALVMGLFAVTAVSGTGTTDSTSFGGYLAVWALCAAAGAAITALAVLADRPTAPRPATLTTAPPAGRTAVTPSPTRTGEPT
ncbi:MFS transporter [Nocardia carnea]|uniref:MFS transporter n=1 Tax=Nocardia carnea TaxID=37328 RepID=UPI002456651D|nr:MFS transporter [Nocardia carnea]